MKRYLLNLVGEAKYQDSIRWVKPGHPVTLAHEPSNRFDPRAVVAKNGAGETIGYAPRDGWMTRALVDEGCDVRARVFAINGGQAGSPSLGVVLEVFLMDSPEEVLPRFTGPEPVVGGDFASGLASGWRGGTPGPARMPAEVATGNIVRLVAVVGGVLLLAMCVSSQGGSGDAPENSPPPAALSREAVAQCRALIASAEKSGLVRGRPSPDRLNVDEVSWAALPAATKDTLMQAVACDLWQASMPPNLESVVVYGYRSGKRLQMLTSVGISRE